MPRLTITLSNERYQALKEAATKRRKSLVCIIDESLEYYGIKSGQTAAELVAKARQHSALSENDSLELAVEETKLHKIQKLHGLQAADVDRILTEIVVNALWREPVLPVSAPDSGDDHLWALMKACRGSVLLTGDRLLLENPTDFASVLKPLSFLESGLIDQ